MIYMSNFEPLRAMCEARLITGETVDRHAGSAVNEVELIVGKGNGICDIYRTLGAFNVT